MKHHLYRIASAAISVAALASCAHLPDSSPAAPGVSVTVTASATVVVPAGRSARSSGLMFYPGAQVDPRAYVPLLSLVAADGVPVIIARMPANLAVLSPDAGIALKSLLRGVTTWVIGGHSLGGVMAAWSAADHPDAWAGLVLLAAYPSTSRSLRAWSHPVLSLTGSSDGLSTRKKIDDARGLLPQPQVSVSREDAYPDPTSGGGTVFHEIAGGNHAQFGSYGPQDGDGVAQISASAQRSEAADYILLFFRSNRW